MKHLCNGLYYLFLGLWFGALVMLAVGAASTFKTIRAAQTEMTGAEQNQLAGSIVGSTIGKLAVIQITCAVVIAICVALQCTVFKSQAGRRRTNALRIALLLLLAVILGADRLIVAPSLHEQRAKMHSDPAARASFDRLHQRSVQLASTSMLLLALVTLVSPFALSKASPRRHGDTEK